MIFLQYDVDEPQRSRSYLPGPSSGLYTIFFVKVFCCKTTRNTQTIYTMIKPKTQKNPSQKTKNNLQIYAQE